jgi:hypothetical protein
VLSRTVMRASREPMNISILISDVRIPRASSAQCADAPELDDLCCGVESAVHIFRREGIDDRAREPDQNKVGLIGLQDFGDRDSLVLKLRESHAVARLSESCGDGVSDEALHCRCLAVGATSRKR